MIRKFNTTLKRKVTLVAASLILATSIAPPITQVVASRDFSGTNQGDSSGGGGSSSRPGGGSSSGGSSSGGSSSGGSSSGGSIIKDRDRDRDRDHDRDHCCCCEIYIPDPYETNFRTMQVLDAVSIVNEHSESASDYRPTIKPIVEELPEFKMADIIEYVGLEDNQGITPRENVPVIEGTSKEHASKLEDLISKNIINRDTEYILSSKGAIISPRRERPDSTGRIDTLDGYEYKKTDWSHNDGGRLVQKYERPSQHMSKTDFIVELMKTEKLEEAPPILVRSRYSRVDNRGMHQFVDVEELERSPYQDKMGELGLDSGQTDIMVSHKLFGKTEVITTNDIPELYLRRAYNKGFFYDNEFITKGDFGKFLNKYMLTGQPSVYNEKAPRYSLTHKPMRMFYQNKYPTGKQWEMDNLNDGQYPEKLSKWKEIIEEDKRETLEFDKESPIWGEAYDYYYYPDNGIESSDKWLDRVSGGKSLQWHITNDWTNDTGMRIVRKRNKLEDPENGYGFFKQENISIIEAFKYAAKHLKINEGEKSFSQEELDYINANYSLDMTKMTVEEKEAVKYLIAKGVISGDDTDLSRTINKPLTNEVGIDLLWRIVNKEERHKIVPELNETDRAMLNKGYKKAKVNINSTSSILPDTYIDRAVEQTQGEPMQTLEEAIYKGDGRSLSEYDIIFVKSPTPTLMDGNITMKLVTNDKYRGEIQGFPVTQSGTEIPITTKGAFWNLYVVHKDHSHNLMIVGETNDRSFHYTGINGEGLYTLPENDNVGKATRWDLNDIRTNKAIRSYFDKNSLEAIDNQIGLIKDRSYERQIASKPDSLFKGLTRLAGITNKEENLRTALLAKAVKRRTNFTDSQIVRAVTKESREGPLISRVIWESPEYLSLKRIQGHVVLGPIQARDLESLKFRGQPLVVKESDSEYSINPDNMSLEDWEKQAITDGNFRIVKTQPTRVDLLGENRGSEQFLYTVRYPVQSKQYKMEMGNFLSDIEHIDGNDDSIRISGYAQLDSGDSKQTLISKAELEDLGVTVISDKILENKNTGQRAFINTHDSYTLIGNNITQYKESDLMVNAFGSVNHKSEEGSPIFNREKQTGTQAEESKIFYNLDMVMELLNDTNVVKNSIASSVDVAFSNNEFIKVPVIDAERLEEGKKDNSIMDFTYVINSNEKLNSNKDFVNLSALGGTASNFIYYKNKAGDNPLSILMVYAPTPGYRPTDKTIDNTLENKYRENPKSEVLPKDTTNSKLVYGTNKGLEERENEIRDLKGKVIETLFKGVNNGKDFFNGDYTYNIYILTDSDTDQDIARASFLSLVAKGDKNLIEKLNKISKYKAGEPMEGSTRESELTINFIKAGDSVNQDVDFVEDKDTGNLYMYMADINNVGVSNNQSSKYSSIFRQNLFLNSTKDSKELRFRQKRAYENTPDNFIPLEIYAENLGSYGSMFLGGGRKMYNFRLPTPEGKYKSHYKYRIPGADNGNASDKKTGGNYHLTSDNIGLFTHLEMPWVELPVGDKMEGVLMDNRKNPENKKYGDKIDIDLSSRGSKGANFARDILGITVNIFENEINKGGVPEKGNYPAQYADGDINTNPKYSISEILKKSKVGLDMRSSNIPAALMSGTWEGILTEGRNYSNFHLYKEIEEGRIPEPTPEQPIVVITAGITPAINNRLGGIGDSSLNSKNNEVNIFAIELTSKDYLSNYKIGTQKVRKINSMEELNAIVQEKEDVNKRVFIKPSIGIPHGSTLVGRNGSLLFRPHLNSRSEVLYAGNIINSLVFRTSLPKRTDLTFLSEVPEGSVITFPGSNEKVIKVSKAEEFRENNNLRWVKTVTVPSETYRKGKKDLFNATLLYEFLNVWGDIQIPYDGVDGATVPLKSIMANSSSKLASQSLLKTMNNVNFHRNVRKYFEGMPMWVDPDQEIKDPQGRILYEPALKTLRQSSNSQVTLTEEKSHRKTASPVLDITMPPTIIVEEVKDSKEALGKGHEYEIVGYYDISGFNVDKDNSYTKYLRDRDTPAINILEGLEVVDSLNIGGMKFRDIWKQMRERGLLVTIVNFLHAAVPIIAYTTVVLINVFWVFLKLPISRGLITEISYKLGGNLAEELAVGRFREDRLPKAVTLLTTSVFIMFIGMLFDSKQLWKLFLEMVYQMKLTNRI